MVEKMSEYRFSVSITMTKVHERRWQATVGITSADELLRQPIRTELVVAGGREEFMPRLDDVMKGVQSWYEEMDHEHATKHRDQPSKDCQICLSIVPEMVV